MYGPINFSMPEPRPGFSFVKKWLPVSSDTQSFVDHQQRRRQAGAGGAAPRAGDIRIGLEKEYQVRCAVTGERTRPVLDAAHIKPFSLVQEHNLSNGLLLRKDIHKLFDDGYVTVTPDRRFLVSKAIRVSSKMGATIMPSMARPSAIPYRRKRGRRRSTSTGTQANGSRARAGLRAAR